MKDLILHIGPAKCGSTSIQKFFQRNKDNLIDGIDFYHLKTKYIKAFLSSRKSKEVSNYFKTLLCLGKTDKVILSHEYLFQCPEMIRHIAFLAKEYHYNIKVIGYSRRQSNFLISAYNQWLFRWKKSTVAIKECFLNLNLDQTLFTGLEKNLITAIYTDFKYAKEFFEGDICNWERGYNNIHKIKNDYCLDLIPGIMDNERGEFSLISDFCLKAAISISNINADQLNKRENLKFETSLIEAFNTALYNGKPVPSPHDNINELNNIAKEIMYVNTNSITLIEWLSMYIDNYYFLSNKRFCEKISYN